MNPLRKLLRFRNILEKTQLTSKYFRSEEHTSELQSLMRISYAVFCLTKTRITLIIYLLVRIQYLQHNIAHSNIGLLFNTLQPIRFECWTNHHNAIALLVILNEQITSTLHQASTWSHILDVQHA